MDLTYAYEHMGTTAADIKAAAKSAFVKAMKDGSKPMIIVGPGVLQRTDAKAVLKSIYELTATAGMFQHPLKPLSSLFSLNASLHLSGHCIT